MPLIVSVNSLLSLKKAFFLIYYWVLKNYPIHLNAHEQSFKDKLVF